jgi:hypothetical protein
MKTDNMQSLGFNNSIGIVPIWINVSKKKLKSILQTEVFFKCVIMLIIMFHSN